MNGIPSIQYTSCPNCKKLYLVGIDNKETLDKGSHGKAFDTGYFAISNAELTESNTLPDKYPCKNCGTICEVKEGKEQ